MKIFGQLLSVALAMNGRVHEMSVKHHEKTSAPTCSAATEAACADKITWLPGLEKLPSFEMYSGYVHPTATKKLHYWFVQSQSNPATDPVVVWFNGGPGCSSMEGFMAEHGPLHMNDDDTISMNPNAWNQKANMIYLEAPVGVGFSTGAPSDFDVISDDTTSSDNRDAIKDFFTKFPEYLENGLYISGESYAGIYVPTLISKIVDDDILRPHFKGAAIGNGLYNWEKNQNSMIFFAKYHGLIDKRNWEALREHCCVDGHTDQCDFFNFKTKKCEDMVNKVVELTWSGGLDVYNLYAECAGGVSRRNLQNTLVKNGGLSFEIMENIKPVGDAPPCTNDTALEVYFNSKATKEAIHVDLDIDWTLCNEELGYQTQTDDVSKYILHALDTVPDSRILLFAGDVDMACNFLGGEDFVEALGLPEIQDYEEWTYMAGDNTRQVGGWCKKYERLSWVTVKGAGHMVPTDLPIPAYEMFQAFLDGKL